MIIYKITLNGSSYPIADYYYANKEKAMLFYKYLTENYAAEVTTQEIEVEE